MWLSFSKTLKGLIIVNRKRSMVWKAAMIKCAMLFPLFNFTPKLCLHSMKCVSYRSVYFGCFCGGYERRRDEFVTHWWRKYYYMPGENCKLSEFDASRNIQCYKTSIVNEKTHLWSMKRAKRRENVKYHNEISCSGHKFPKVNALILSFTRNLTPKFEVGFLKLGPNYFSKNPCRVS